MQTVGFVSLGCSKNLVDSEIMLSRLQVDGFDFVPDPAEADVIVVNTCTFIDSAKEESINTILDMARYKDIGRCKRLVVAGCLAHRYREQVLKEIPEVDALITLDELDKIEEACRGTYRQQTGAAGRSRRLYGVADGRLSTSSAHTRYLKISEGCDHKCSFCVIPTFRGLHRSRPVDDLVSEAGRLVAEGAKELSLVAQDLGAYGKDLGEEVRLATLLRELNSIEGIGWIRLHYIYPQGLTAELQQAIAGLENVAPYLDIPFQHGSSKVLKDMRRPGNTISSLKKISELRKNIPGLAIRTSIITGFPTETEQDFEELMDFIREVRFDHLGVFTYSHEENSEAAARFEDSVPEEIKRERRDAVLELQQSISLEKNEKLLGETVEVLIDGLHPESDLLLAGRMITQATDVDGLVIINEGEGSPGEFRNVNITEAHPYDLVGRIIHE